MEISEVKRSSRETNTDPLLTLFLLHNSWKEFIESDHILKSYKFQKKINQRGNSARPLGSRSAIISRNDEENLLTEEASRELEGIIDKFIR